MCFFAINFVIRRIGLTECPKEVFWAHIAEYPAHDKSIPLPLENEFVRALTNGKRGGCDLNLDPRAR